MKELDKSNYPHGDLIRDNETITLRSIFDFAKGAIELFPFLLGCQKCSCTVIFKNENITVQPESDSAQDLILSFYACISEQPKIADDYIKYLTLFLRSGKEVKRIPQIANATQP